MLKSLGARLTAGAGFAALLVFSAEAAELQLKRVMLSSGGVGYFEYQAEVEGWETIEVPVRIDQVDDVLKSAVIFDNEGGSGVVELQGRDSLAEIFRTMPVGPEAFESPAALYGALKGEEVSVSEPVSATGRIVSVVEETAQAMTLVLPQAPVAVADNDDVLSDDELEMVAAGMLVPSYSSKASTMKGSFGR